jgi:hypothetical protein
MLEGKEIIFYSNDYSSIDALMRSMQGIQERRKFETGDPKITIVFHSNEACGHNRPHCHITFGGHEYVFAIDDNPEAIVGKEFGSESYIVKKYILHFQRELRDYWNRCTNSSYKFVEDEMGNLVVPPKKP